MQEAICISCGDSFVRDYDWKKLCMACWIESKNKDGNSSTASEKLDQLKRALGANKQDELIKSLTARAVPDKVMLKRLIQLSHPDRHGNSQASQIATSWLLDVSKEFSE